MPRSGSRASDPRARASRPGRFHAGEAIPLWAVLNSRAPWAAPDFGRVLDSRGGAGRQLLADQDAAVEHRDGRSRIPDQSVGPTKSSTCSDSGSATIISSRTHRPASLRKSRRTFPRGWRTGGSQAVRLQHARRQGHPAGCAVELLGDVPDLFGRSNDRQHRHADEFGGDRRNTIWRRWSATAATPMAGTSLNQPQALQFASPR